MPDEIPTHPFASEATNPDTSPERLAILAQIPQFMLLVAANPAAPPHILKLLSDHRDSAIRHAVVQNPNASLSTLLQLACEFPHEFLANPVIPLLNLAQPDFIEQFFFPVWLALLRCEEIPVHWLHHLRQSNLPSYKQPEPHLVTTHIALVGKTTHIPEDHMKDAITRYKQKLNYIGVSNVSRTIFSLFILSFPDMASSHIRKLAETGNDIKKILFTPLPAVTTSTLEAMVELPHTDVRRRVALYPTTSATLLTNLAIDVSEVRRAVANNPKTPAEILDQLAYDSTRSVRQAVAHNHRTPLALLKILADDPEPVVRAAAATHQRLDTELYYALATDPQPLVRASVARNVRIPQDILTALVRDSSPKVRAATARNTHLSAASFSMMLNDQYPDVRCGLARNTQAPPYILEHLLYDPSPTVQAQVAANPRTPYESLDFLFRTHNQEVWYGLARNSRTRPELLAQMAEHANDRVLAALAGNKRTPVETLRWITTWIDKKFRSNRGVNRYTFSATTLISISNICHQLAKNPHTPLDVLEHILSIKPGDHMYHSFDHLLYIKIAHHPAVLRDQRRILFKRFEEELKDMTLRNTESVLKLIILEQPGLPSSTLEIFARSISWGDRCLVATHPATPQELLEELTHDGHSYVRAAARTALTKISEN